MEEVNTLAETMFGDMPEAEKGKEQDRLKDASTKRTKGMAMVTEGRQKYSITN
jgi:hypothetical protein